MTQSPTELARTLFQEEGLPFPPAPAALASQLQTAGDHVFATRKIDVTPYGIESFRNEASSDPALQDYVLVGFDGYGVNSWAVHYYLVEGPLALFVQLPWGGAYVDADQARERIARVFTWAARLQERVGEARERALIPPGWRLLAVVSTFAHPGFAWLPPQRDAAAPTAEDDSESASAGNLLAAIDEAVDQLLARGVPLGQASP